MLEQTSHLLRNVSVGIALSLAVISAGWYWYGTHPTNNPHPEDFSFTLSEKIENWQFKGVYTGNSELEKKAQADIDRLNGMFGTEGNTDYILYVSIAGQYELLGDGAKEYEYLLRALAEDSEKTGLAWYNLGVLLTRLGAFESARVAYEKAVAAQPQMDQYQTRYLEFLTQQFPKDEKAIEQALRDAEAILGEQPTLLEIHARWLEGVGRIQEAIVDWKKIRELSPGSAPAIQSELRRLEGKL
jgi:tetratricopeptide (TPR) repeat protein